jgi:hypothetical protein
MNEEKRPQDLLARFIKGDEYEIRNKYGKMNYAAKAKID